VTPPGRPRPSKVTVLLEFLVRRFSERAAPWAQRDVMEVDARTTEQ
jgi:hypothetical protein